MAMGLCKCGAFKSMAPYRSSITRAWMCDKCAGKGRTKEKALIPVIRREEEVFRIKLWSKRTSDK